METLSGRTNGGDSLDEIGSADFSAVSASVTAMLTRRERKSVSSQHDLYIHRKSELNLLSFNKQLTTGARHAICGGEERHQARTVARARDGWDTGDAGD
eukprot:1199868-Pleurochrysis_carterae.AAC.1